MQASATGFLVKDTEPAEPVYVVRVPVQGDGFISPSVTRRLIADLTDRPHHNRGPDQRLDAPTRREREAMRLIATGHANDEIAPQLVVSPLTAKTCVSRIMGKLDARDRSQVVVRACEYRMVSPGRPAD
ncbi:LuxR C-terminal-related transcriptional regulator [Streptomyces sp. NPDC127072]|uniref:LuxR C-terminal-related transcriptional regulator n=1 Tax=Streptomyces sp. NPDC127072 TaxID=3347129 RepID=UPI003664FD68